MNTPNVSSVLDRASDTIERPKAYPIGHYNAVVKGQPVFDKSSQKKTDYVQLQYQLLSPKDDVDAEALAEMGGIKPDKPMREKYYLTEDAAFRLVDALDALGAGESGDTLRSRIAMTPNCPCVIQVRHKPTQDGKSVFAEVGAVLPAE